MADKHEGAAEGATPDRIQPSADDFDAGEATGAATGSLQARVEEEKAKSDKNLANWQRAEADLANFKRRAEQERADLGRYGNVSLIRKILPVLDDFERAIESIPADVQSEGWVEGVKLIDRKLRNVLEQEGVNAIEAEGKEFDPHIHEAVMHEGGEGDTDMVVQEFQRGYRLHDRVIRPAMVKVGRRDRSSSSRESQKE